MKPPSLIIIIPRSFQNNLGKPPGKHFIMELQEEDILATAYRVNTNEICTFKMIQKTSAAYLELHTYTSR
jgi:hypothetical protein